MEKLINYGGAVKALGDGKVSGYLVVFGSPDETDVSSLRDYFTPETDFDIAEGAKTAIYYRHALNPKLQEKVGEGSLKVDDVGVWVEGQLDLRNRYVKAVYEQMATKGKLGWSSGTALHLIQREEQENGSHKIARWPLGLDASITPDPAEPRTAVVAAMKTLEAEPDPIETDPALKSLLGDTLLEEASLSAVRAFNDRLFYRCVYECIYDWQRREQDDPTPLDERLTTLAAAFDEFRDLSLRVIEAVLTAAPEADDPEDAMKALKSLWGPAEPETLATRAAKVVSAAAAVTEGLETRLEVRKTDGRTLSRADRESLKSLCEALGELDAVKAHLSRLQEQAEPTSTPSPDPALLLEQERLRTLLRTQIALAGIN